MAAPLVPMNSWPIYVGDLHSDVTEANLFELFSTMGMIQSVRICRVYYSGCSRGYGYVNFASKEDALHAIEKLNHAILCGVPIRVMLPRYDPDSRNSGIGNVFVKNLSGSIDAIKLEKMFSKFGAILSCKVAVEDGKSKEFGFVQFESQDSAILAIENLNGTIVDGKKIYVGMFIKKSDRVSSNHELKYNNLYVKNLDKDITEELLELKFSEFGKVINVVIEKNEEGNSKGFGFVNFKYSKSAKKAVETLNGLQLGSKKLYVAMAQKKPKKKVEILPREFQDKCDEKNRKYMASNLYVKNIDDNVDDNDLLEHFSRCGTVTSAKVMRNDKGISKGFGFVCFGTQEEAAIALNTLHGYIFHGKPLYVAIAQRKEERREKLLLQHSQRVVGLVGSAADAVSTSYPQIYYESLESHSELQSRFAPSRPVFQPTPFSFCPDNSRNQQPNWSPKNEHMQPQVEQSVSYISHLQQLSNSLKSLLGLNGQQTNNIQNGRHLDISNFSQPLPASSNPQEIEMLSSVLAASTPQQQKQILWQNLFPLVQKLKGDLAHKITEMLLTMDNSKLLFLLYSPESLSAKVEEVAQVLNLSKTNKSSNFLSTQIAVN